MGAYLDDNPNNSLQKTDGDWINIRTPPFTGHIKFRSESTDGFNAMFAFGHNGGGTGAAPWITLLQRNTGTVEAEMRDGVPTSIIATSTKTVTASKWHQATMSLNADGSRLTLLFDWEVTRSTGGGLSLSGTAYDRLRLGMGTLNGWGEDWHGTLCDAAFWNIELPLGAMMAVHSGRSPTEFYPTNLKHYFPLQGAAVYIREDFGSKEGLVTSRPRIMEQNRFILQGLNHDQVDNHPYQRLPKMPFTGYRALRVPDPGTSTSTLYRHYQSQRAA
jgi:hypothetical protein